MKNVLKIEKLDAYFIESLKSFFIYRIVGSYGLVLQQLIEDGYLRVTDSMVDVNNMPTEASALKFQIIIIIIVLVVVNFHTKSTHYQ